MDLSNDLISKFVKITNDGNKKETKEGTVYGTTVEYDGAMYVKIDGSDLLTPIDTTADIKEGERVTIMIKDHNATVTGNITSPSASSADVKKVTRNVEEIEGEITEFEAIIADVVHVGELDAEVARIDELIAGKAAIEDLTATNAEITNLKAKDAEIENLVAEKATIEDLTATNAEITNLKAKDAEIENLVAEKATIEDLTATNAKIDSLQANKADINYLDANFATINELEATHAEIEILDAEVADINTLVNGNLTSDNILSFNITSQNTTMENAFVKDAMIDTVTANKIMSGTIDTNNVTIQSTDGSMLLQGTLLQMKDDNGKVRIQIGKDTGGNFTFILYDESGTGVLIDEEGIKSSDAIADGLIVDAKVADNANIAGSKLDIASVITEVNNDNSTTIKSNKIYLDEQGQSLEVAFNSLKTQVETIQDVTIDGDLTSIVEQVQSNTTQIEANKEGISTLVAENTIRKEEIQNLDGEIESVNNTLSSKYSSLEQDVSGFKTTVAETYTTKTEFNNLEIGGTNTFRMSTVGSETWDINYGSSVIANSENGFNVITTNGKMHIRLCHTIKDNGYWTVRFKVKSSVFVGPIAIDICDKATNNFSSDTNWTEITRTVLVDNYSVDPYNFVDIEQHVDCGQAIEYYFKDVKVEKGDRPTDWSPAPEDIQGQIDATNNNLATNYSTTTQMNSAIDQKANEITSSVSQTYTTKTEFNNLEVGGTNLVYNGGFNRNLDGWNANGNSNGVQACTESPSGYMALMDVTSHGHGLYQRFTFHDSTYCTDYVVSFYAKTNVDGSQMYVSMEGDPATSSVFTLNGGWQKCVYKFRRSTTGSNALVFYANESGARNIYIHSIKMEKGTVPSAWSPHPSEIENKVDNLSNNLTTNYSTTTQMNSAINQKANEITSSVSQTYVTNYEAKKLADTTTAGLNRYLFERYQRDGFDYSTRPTLNDLVGARLIESQLMNHPPAHTSDLGSGYIGVLTFYLYYDYACIKTVSVTTDDNGTIYLNNVGIYELTSCQPANVTFNMIKGLNRIDIVYAEIGGSDGVSWGGVDGYSAFGAYANVVTNEIAKRTNELTLAMTQGNMLYTDPTFRTGINGVFIYNNNSNGTVTVERIAAIEGCPNTSGQCMRIITSGSAAPGLGGFHFKTSCRYNAVFITKITAKIPVGYTIKWASNPYGDNGEQKWLSTTSGTGDWHDYYCKVKCGNSGDLKTTNFFYLEGPQASAENPVTWYVSYATVFDVTDSDERITNLTNNLATNYSTTTQMNSAIDQKANEITSSVSQTYTTKSETTAVQNQITTSRNLLMGSRDYNLGKWRSEGAAISDEWYNGTRIYTTSQEWANMDYLVSDLIDRGVIELSTPYTFSCYVMSTGSDYTPDIHFYAEDLPYFSNTFCGRATTSWQRISITIEWSSFDNRSNPIRFEATTSSPSGSYLKWACFQLERGRVATGWGPAPEDAQYAINDINNNLATNFSTTTQMNSAIQQKANEITSSVSQAYVTKSEAATMNDTVAGNHKWLFEQYTNSQSVATGNGAYPTLAHLANETLIASRLVDSLPVYTSELGNMYLGVYTVYLYYESAYTWNGSIISDDESTTYLNGVVVCQAPSCTSTAFTMNFKKGINKLQIIHGEGYGGDGVTLSDLGPWKEYGAYPACVAAASSNYYASNSDIVQTVNDLTIKFTESGGYNLLQNGHADKGTSYWVNNGGGLSIIGGAEGGVTGNYFATGLPTGIKYYDWVRLLPNTHYVYQAKVWTDLTFNGHGSVPLHFWFSYDASTNTGDGYTILDYQQNVSYANTWTQCYIHFVTGNANIYFKPIIYNNQVTTATFYVSELMLSQSRVVQPWSPHPSEIYSGITQIDKDGIRVQHSNFNGYTHMAPSGFYVNHNGADVVALDAAGLRVTGSITASSGHIGGTTTIDGNCLVAGTVGANAIAAGSITANKLCIGDTNNYCQLTKGVTLTSQYGTSTWSGSDSHCYWASSSTYLPFTMDGTRNPFKEGDRLLFDLDMYSEAYAGSRNFRVYFYSDDNSAVYITDCGTSVEILAGWNNYKFEVVINNAWVKAAKTIAILAHIRGVYTEVRNVVIRRKVSGELIVDGSITADKIAADAITGKTITGGTISGASITGGSIDIGGNFSVNSAGTLTTNSQIYAQGGIYTYQDIRGLDDTYRTGGLTLVSGTGNVAVRTEAPAHSVYIQPASGEAYVTYPSSSNLADLRLKNLFSEQTNASLGNFGLAQLYSTNAYLEFMYGLGVIRVAEANHLYLQCGSSAGNTSTEVRCTNYKNPNVYTNIRAYNVCAQNAVYANGVNVSSDRDRKRDIELYDTDALNEICTTPVYTYHLDTDLDEEVKRIGIIMQEAPLDAIDLSGKGVDLYQMVTMLWRAVQQQQEMINELKGE